MSCTLPEYKQALETVRSFVEDGESGAAQSASGYDAVFAINADLAQEPEKLDAALEQNAQFIFGSHPMSVYDDFLNFLYGTCNLWAYLDDATAQLTAIGYIKEDHSFSLAVPHTSFFASGDLYAAPMPWAICSHTERDAGCWGASA